MKTLMSQNRFLTDLSLQAREGLDPHLEIVELHKSQFFGESGLREDMVYFPLNCLCSIDLRMTDGFYAHLALLGFQQIVGTHRLVEPALPGTTRVLASGYALQTPAANFRKMCDRFTDLQRATQDAVVHLTRTLGHATACNLHHPLQKRLARWLLSAADATAQHNFELTHEELACLLGVRREAVTESLARLSQAGAIDTTRGRVTIRNEQTLFEVTCECYGLAGGKRGSAAPGGRYWRGVPATA